MTIPTSQVMAYKANSGNLYSELEECLIDNIYYGMYFASPGEFARIVNTNRCSLLNFITLATNNAVLEHINNLQKFYNGRTSESSSDLENLKNAVNKVLHNIRYIISTKKFKPSPIKFTGDFNKKSTNSEDDDDDDEYC